MLVNQMEFIVEEIYQEMIKSFPEFCNCKVCKADVVCMALNQLQPLYNTTLEGQAYAKLLEHQPQFKVHVMQVVGSAIQQVSENPRH